MSYGSRDTRVAPTQEMPALRSEADPTTVIEPVPPSRDRAGRRSSPAERPVAPSKRVTSIARSIALHQWARKLFGFLLLDVVLAAGFVGIFAWRCFRQLPPGGIAFWSRATNEASRYASVDTRWWPGGSLWSQDLVAHADDGSVYAFPLSDLLEFAVPILVALLVAEVVALVWGVFDTRRIRRKLKPLNDLALTAEAISSAAAVDPTFGISNAPGRPKGGHGGGEALDMDQLVTLEHAITSASVDSPQVSTGDKDLRSIEIALNSLLKRMQEAKLQQMRFVSDASHELRTPIAVLQGYVNMLDRWGKTDPEVLDESIEALKAEVNHMQELVEQLLFLARGDSGRNTLQKTTFNLAEVAAEVCDESAMIDPEHLYVLEPAGIAPDDLRFSMVGDLAMVKQSMRIIVQNAAKYSPAGTTVTISVRAEGGQVCYSVQDEGMGMSEKDTAHIFERFYRADAARGERGDGRGGTGLGLAIAKWIVDAHEGTIEVVSREGVGTRFTVRFG